MQKNRICPVCNIALQENRLQQEIIDRCPQCNGIYFDEGELESIVELVHFFIESDLQEEEIDTISHPERQRILHCPVDNTIMDKHEICGQVIDICQKCKGIWLDNKEVVALKIAETHIKRNLNLYIRLGN